MFEYKSSTFLRVKFQDPLPDQATTTLFWKEGGIILDKRVFVLSSSSLNGICWDYNFAIFWCARILLSDSASKALFFPFVISALAFVFVPRRSWSEPNTVLNQFSGDESKRGSWKLRNFQMAPFTTFFSVCHLTFFRFSRFLFRRNNRAALDMARRSNRWVGSNNGHSFVVLAGSRHDSGKFT